MQSRLASFHRLAKVRCRSGPHHDWAGAHGHAYIMKLVTLTLTKHLDRTGLVPRDGCDSMDEERHVSAAQAMHSFVVVAVALGSSRMLRGEGQSHGCQPNFAHLSLVSTG